MVDSELAVTLTVSDRTVGGVRAATFCVELARTDGSGDVGAVPVASVPGVGHQLPALIALDQTPIVGGILCSHIVSTEETLPNTAQHSPQHLLLYRNLLQPLTSHPE